MTEWKIVFCPGSLGKGKAAAKVAKKGPVAMKHNARDACKAEARAAWAEREQRYRPSSKNEAERTRGQSDRRGKESVCSLPFGAQTMAERPCAHSRSGSRIRGSAALEYLS
ncbi:hypothetical protein [Curvibacter lanceolatus]|uniref:hypothetical protein n=1 Tax=Curvibacter lanceolatus TaxID=86182 RepID=UPI0003753A83|nr:hypothetical protein [Curvibacter lanceolatus]